MRALETISVGVMENNETMDLQRAAEFLNMSASALRYKAKQGIVKGAKPAKRWVFLKHDLVAFIRSHYDVHVEMPLSDSIHREVKICHSINAEIRGGLASQHQTDNEYVALLGLKKKT